MGNPQLENGYTKIANDILDALARFRIPGEQMQCLFFIFRKTYGYNKKEDAISNSQFVQGTGLKKGNVSRALKLLSKKQLVIKNDNKKIPSYQFNKVFSSWKLLSKKQLVIKKATSVIKSDNKVLSKVMDTKERKKTIQKKTTFLSDSEEIRLSNFLLSKILKRDPNHKKPEIQKWAKNIDLLLRIDKRSTAEIEKVIEWCQEDEFWQNNILSTGKLREKFDTLFLKMNSSEQKYSKDQWGIKKTTSDFGVTPEYLESERKRMEKLGLKR